MKPGVCFKFLILYDAVLDLWKWLLKNVILKSSWTKIKFMEHSSSCNVGVIEDVIIVVSLEIN